MYQDASHTNSRLRAGEIARALGSRAEEIAVTLLGEPSSRSRRELRWGRHGSIWLGCTGEKRGRWHDHERGEGGDLLDLIAPRAWGSTRRSHRDSQ